MANLASSSFQHDPANFNGVPQLSTFAIDAVFKHALASKRIAGGSVKNVVAFATSARAGAYASGFSDSFYHRIWVIEKRTDLGNIVANQERTIELWNSHFEDKTFTGYTVTGDITVDGLASGTMSPLRSELYTVSIPLVGAPSLDATIEWAFTDAEALSFVASILAQRVIPFTMRHNWRTPVLEQISFKTDVLGAISGKEQRIGLIPEPRRRFEMSYLTLTPLERSYLENVLFGWHGRSFAVPLWSDVTMLRSDAAEGSTSFDVDTVSRDFDTGGLVYITDGISYDTLEVLSVTTNSVTTKTGSLNGYTEGARIVPARLGILDSKIDLSRLTSTIEDIKLAWAIQSDQVSTHRRQAYTPVTYRGVEVFNLSNDYSEELGISQAIAEQIQDNGIGAVRKDSIGGQRPRRTYPFRELRSRSELPQFLEWVYQRKGKLNPFWFVERVPSFFLETSALSTDTNFVVTTGGYTQFSFQSTAHRDVAIKTTAGWKYRRITGSSVNDDGTETITLDSSLGVALTASDEPLMSLLKFVRLDQDMVELSYESASIIKTATTITDLLTNN